MNHLRSPSLPIPPASYLVSQLAPAAPATEDAGNRTGESIKAYCLDFNWAPTKRRGRPFAKPGQWAAADPAEHVAWYEAIGANVIQTFAVSTNGYAWYKGGFVPEQPGLKHDFLPEMVKLGHQRGMKVFGYFCIASNPRWAELHPEQTYGSPTTYHIPYTDDYLDYLSKSIHDAVTRTHMDGFMIDWVWMPNRASTKGQWLDCEKQLYRQLMGENFPGEDKLTKEQDTAYSRKAIARCWETIRKAAKTANPECIIWLTVNNMHHPHVIHSEMYREVDWLMNEAGRVEEVLKARDMVGKHTRLITCLAAWNGVDPSTTVPAAIEHDIGLYGFTTPTSNQGTVKLEPVFASQLTELSGDSKNIAALARAYHGKSSYALWNDGHFLEMENPPSFLLSFQGRGRGLQDTATIETNAGSARILVKTPYGAGSGNLIRTGDDWPAEVTIQLEKRPGEAPAETTHFAFDDGTNGLLVTLGTPDKSLTGTIDPKAKTRFSKSIRFSPGDDWQTVAVPVERTETHIRIPIPNQILVKNPPEISFQWDKQG